MTYEHEVSGGFLWSPKTKKNGERNPFYDFMTEIQPGDLVYSFNDTLISAIGVAQTVAATSPKPFPTISNWNDEGWYVEVDFKKLEKPFRPKDHLDLISPLLNDKYSPLQKNGNGNQFYLTEVSEDLGRLLSTLSAENIPLLQHDYAPIVSDESEYEREMLEIEFEFKKISGDTEKIQIAKSRRGQGIFKANVKLVERSCRITGVDNPRHLRASHIKPWSHSRDDEKIDGYNGLLLSPHVDHLFDGGFISFKDDGELITAADLNIEVLERWAIPIRSNVGTFKPEQTKYLEYHRDVILR